MKRHPFHKPGSALPGDGGRGSASGTDGLLERARSLRALPDWNDWRFQSREAVRWGAALCRGREEAGRIHRRYPVRVTPYYLSLCETLDRSDPLAAQCLPDPRELEDDGKGRADPFSEQTDHAVGPGMVRRFEDRLLLMCAATCPMFCRHCTRKNLLHGPGPDRDLAGPGAMGPVIDYVRAHPAVREVILSGGEPLLRSDAAVAAMVGPLVAEESLDAIRVGTRAPVTLPMRVTPGLARLLGRDGKVWVNTQFNHPREITPEAAAACRRLVAAGVPVSNQCVILRGVNDDADTLCRLFAGLQRHAIRPYYAFAPDPVRGTAHFRVSLERIHELALTVERRLGGLAVPKFVVDVPGAPSKVPVERRLRRESVPSPRRG